VSNGKRAIPAVLLAPVAVTKENLEAVLVGSGYLTRAAIFGD
jgi:ABC-type xylose transport system substrate-binding protein